MTSPKSPPSLAALAAAILGVASSHAAPINWSAPFNITSIDDIDTAGVHHTAVNTTSDSTQRSITVGAETIVFPGVNNVGPSSTNTGSFFTGSGGTTGAADLDGILNSHTYGGSAWFFELEGLTAGREYQVQLVGAADTRNCCDGRNQSAGDGENPESVSGDFSRSGPGSVIGTFTADGSTQAISILPGIDDGTDPGISLYIVRDLTSVGPLPPSDITLSNTDLAPSTPAGTTVATIAADDPNPSDSHSFTLHNSAALPDNAFFSIVGNELRAAAELGSFGTSYTIFLRATDSGGLTFDKAFTLAVESAQAPVSVSADANTVPVGAPAGTTVATLSTNDPSSTDSHTYTLVEGVGDADNASFTIDGSSLELAVPAPAAGTTLAARIRSTDLSGLSVEAAFSFVVTSSSLRINEFLADGSSSTLTDEDGEPGDWIELYNPADSPASLSGLYLTDDPDNPTKWPFPAGTSVPARGFIVVFGSGKDRTTTPLHTNFGLGAGGEYLALTAADGITPLTAFGSPTSTYPPQRNATTYGFYGTPAQIGYMLTPTPGAANDDASGTLGFVADTKFSHDRGFYDAPFDLAITTATDDATIRYTTDGSWPSETNGEVYAAPLTISQTTTLKAIATKPGHLPTDIDTHTYIFVDDVVTQTVTSTRDDYGFPTRWGSRAPDYGMEKNPAVNPASHPTIKEDLKAIPSLVVGIDVDDMFGRSGIYSNPTSSGVTWERLTSLEILDPDAPDGSLDHQQNCAIRIQGGAFRNFSLTDKKSFRVIFKPTFGTRSTPTGGPGKLNYPLFSHIDPDASEQFDTLVFRMESNDGWQWGGASGQPQYARDEFGRRSHLALGHPAGHGRYMHLYINGVYWGVYNIVERPDASFAENYLGADKETWQGQNSGTPINNATSIAQWTTMIRNVDDISVAGSDSARDAEYLESYGFNPDGSRNPDLPVWIDATNFIDYLLVNWYGGNSDWPRKNYYGGRDPSSDSTGYKFFMWDSEWSLFMRSNISTDRTTDFSGIAAPQQHLAGDPANPSRFPGSPEYRLRWADRTHRAFFNNGPMSPENCTERYQEITSQHTSILVPEAARWGNQHNQSRDIGDWQTEANRIINSWFPSRGARFIAQLRNRGLYPDTEAPTYSQHGGSVSTTQGVTLSVPDDVERVYYMIGDGDADPTDYAHSLDPRLVGGDPNPAATRIDFTGGGAHVTSPVFFDSPKWLFSRSFDTTTGEWSALNTAFFSIDSVPADSSNLVVSELNYHPYEPVDPAEIAISTDRDDYEFIELLNTSSTHSLDLTGVRFTDGITFSFDDNHLLPPSSYLVLARDTAAYAARYPDATAPLAEYSGRLSNDGEQIVLASASATIHDFTYNDQPAWPVQADGDGPTLTLAAPRPTPDHNDPASWRASFTEGGTPGTEDAFNPAADNDFDGLSALLELALGTSDSQPDFSPFSIDTSNGALTVTFPFNTAVEGVVDLHPESSSDLITWSRSFTQTGSSDNGDGTRSLTFTADADPETTTQLYIRLSATTTGP